MDEIIYNSIGSNYNTNRTADLRILNIIEALLDLPSGSVIADIGAGTGNYSNALADFGYKIKAIEPSETMRNQAKPNDRVTWLSGTAESIPLPEQSVDGIIVILSIHHLSSIERASLEMQRICRAGPIIIFTFDPRVGQEPWFKDYFLEIYQQDFLTFPPLEKVIEAIAFEGSWSKEILSFPLPEDLSDRNMYSAWSEPERYLDARFRQSTSGFALASPMVVQAGLSRLQNDLQSGTWDKKYGYLRNEKAFDAGFKFIKLQKIEAEE